MTTKVKIKIKINNEKKKEKETENRSEMLTECHVQHRDLAEGVAPRVNRFFQTVIEFTVKCVEADTYIQELLQTLCRLFTVIQKPFYSRYGPKGTEVRVRLPMPRDAMKKRERGSSPWLTLTVGGHDGLG